VGNRLGCNLENLNNFRGRAFNVDLIRTVAMVGVILLHASGQWLINSKEMSQLTPFGITSWVIVDFYQTIGVIAVPLFLMLTGALLLQPEKRKESLRVFFKKRWSRVGLACLFWGIVYFVWDFVVQKLPFSFGTILQGALNGPYTQFWYIYVLIGLYLLVPLLRALFANSDQTLMKYFILLWVTGVAILPFFSLLSPFRLNNNVFTIGGYVGYFVLGTYLMTVKLRRSIIWFFLILGIALSAFGTYLLAVTGGWDDMYFFTEYISPTIILAAVMMFIFLLNFKPLSVRQEIDASKPSKSRKLIKIISENTLGIFFLHVIVLESIENGYLGFAINRNTLNPIIEAPLITVIVLFTTLAIILLLKKIPYMNRLIGCV
jgi:surface polysaccharide O-acyltransferase-like enzyme